MKKPDTLLKEYARRLSEDNLGYLHVRFKQNLFGDRAAIAEALETEREVDRWLCSAGNHSDFFDMVDMVGDYVRKEYRRRNGSDEEA